MYIHPRRLEAKLSSVLRDILPDVKVVAHKKSRSLVYNVYVVSDYYNSKDVINNLHDIKSYLKNHWVDYNVYKLSVFPFFIEEYYDKRSGT